MNVLHQELKKNIQVIEKEQSSRVEQDPYRLKFHLMPPVGWLNDPNGLCWFQDYYHVFFQYSPFDVKGGLKVWGHYRSRDLLTWEYIGTPILPDQPYDCHGIYSGSALIDQNKMYLYYTGNVKYDGDFDYIKEGRGANTVCLKSVDGINFDQKMCLLQNQDYPAYYTNHIRDPKVWKEKNQYYMVLGGRKNTDQGAVLLYESMDGLKWNFKQELTTEDAFGYMWECPDLFLLDSKWVLSISPQGLKREEYQYQNIYQSGYFILNEKKQEEYIKADFYEWDMGFDFYAPQTFLDSKGRRILIAWMGLPDLEQEYTNPTTKEGWQHCLTVPRKIDRKGNRLLQYPVEEVEQLRGDCYKIADHTEVVLQKKCFDLLIENITLDIFQVTIQKGLVLSYKNGIFEMSFITDLGAGRKVRKAKILTIESIRILMDHSSCEIFINEGEYVFTTRLYSKEKKAFIKIACEGSQNTVWMMNGYTYQQYA